MIDKAIQEAYTTLETGKPVSRELAVALSHLAGEDVLDLVSLANKVRNRFSPGMHACSIVNAKSGLCGENCRFCAQSLHHAATVEQYGLMDAESLLGAARKVHAEGISRFGIVTSGRGYPALSPEFEAVCGAIDRIHAALPDMEVCASLGMLGDEPARRLAACRIASYNINIQTAPARYGELIADTHTVQERVETIRRLRTNGVPVCCGGIIGMGESADDRVDLAIALLDLDVSVIPINVLIPIAGTPVAQRQVLPAVDVVKTFCIFRLVHPGKVIKFAAGRETAMKDFQALAMLAGANGMITGGYLTTRGRSIGDDSSFIRQLAAFAEPERSS
jgi:biotin synthase